MVPMFEYFCLVPLKFLLVLGLVGGGRGHLRLAYVKGLPVARIRVPSPLRLLYKNGKSYSIIVLVGHLTTVLIELCN